MATMIERVARALYEDRFGPSVAPWSQLKDAHKAPYISDARAAIAAMREPTERMAQAGDDLHDFASARLFWSHMIDAALEEKP